MQRTVTIAKKANQHCSYSPAPEILEYFRGIAKKYELYKYIRLRHMVVGAVWDDEGGIWTLKIKNLQNGEIYNDWCHIMINGSGILKYA